MRYVRAKLFFVNNEHPDETMRVLVIYSLLERVLDTNLANSLEQQQERYLRIEQAIQMMPQLVVLMVT